MYLHKICIRIEYLYDKAKNHNNLFMLRLFFCCAFLFCFAPPASNWITQTKNQLSANYNFIHFNLSYVGENAIAIKSERDVLIEELLLQAGMQATGTGTGTGLL